MVAFTMWLRTQILRHSGSSLVSCSRVYLVFRYSWPVHCRGGMSLPMRRYRRYFLGPGTMGGYSLSSRLDSSSCDVALKLGHVTVTSGQDADVPALDVAVRAS